MHSGFRGFVIHDEGALASHIEELPCFWFFLRISGCVAGENHLWHIVKCYNFSAKVNYFTCFQRRHT